MRNKHYTDIIAYFLGDGTLEHNSRKPYFSSKYLKLLQLYMFKIKTVFPDTELSIRKYAKDSYRQVYEYRLYVENSNTELSQLLTKYFRALRTKTIAKLVSTFLSTDLHAKLFLKGFFDSEGGLYWRKGHGLEIKFSTTNEDLKEITIHSLNKLNIKHSVYVDRRFDKKHKKPCYYVRVFGNNARKLITLTKPYKLFIKEYILTCVDSRYREKLMNLLKGSK